MRDLGISNLVATVLLIAIAVALVIAIAAFVFGLLGNTAKYGVNWLYLYESLYNNYTLLEGITPCSLSSIMSLRVSMRHCLRN